MKIHIYLSGVQIFKLDSIHGYDTVHNLSWYTQTTAKYAVGIQRAYIMQSTVPARRWSAPNRAGTGTAVVYTPDRAGTGTAVVYT